jgi:ABC-type uncharacterized transport system substrate-binding protein
MLTRIRRHAAELVALTPDVILATGAAVTGPLRQATRAVPIVFVQVTDPVGAGFVASLTSPYASSGQTHRRLAHPLITVRRRAVLVLAV